MAEEKIQRTEEPTAAFVLSLLAGLWMLGAGGMMGGLGWRGMMGGWRVMGGMGAWMWGPGLRNYGVWWPWLGVSAGIVVLAGAVLLYIRPEQRRSWGILILIASALDIFLGMGLLAGAMGVIAGILGLGTRG